MSYPYPNSLSLTLFLYLTLFVTSAVFNCTHFNGPVIWTRRWKSLWNRDKEDMNAIKTCSQMQEYLYRPPDYCAFIREKFVDNKIIKEYELSLVAHVQGYSTTS